MGKRTCLSAMNHHALAVKGKNYVEEKCPEAMEAYLIIGLCVHAVWTKTRNLIHHNLSYGGICFPSHYTIYRETSNLCRPRVTWRARSALTTFTTQKSNCTQIYNRLLVWTFFFPCWVCGSLEIATVYEMLPVFAVYLEFLYSYYQEGCICVFCQ